MSLLNVRRTGGENLAAGFPGSKKKSLKKNLTPEMKAKRAPRHDAAEGEKIFGVLGKPTLEHFHRITVSH